jgi:hypothetical protein
MRYMMPNHPCDFEVPDAWLTDSGIAGFIPGASAYLSTPDAVSVLLREIEPPYRSPQTSKDHRGFDRPRMISVLNGIATGAKIDPVSLLALPEGSFAFPAPYRYRVRDGYHRFYASIAAGFVSLPGTIL